jgi:hypothetical protein
MSYWHCLAISAAVIITAIFLYLVMRWRKARTAFRAMSLVATASLMAGVLLGFWGMHTLNAWMRTDKEHTESAPAGSTNVRSTVPGPRTPTADSAPRGSGAASPIALDSASSILAAYVAQALAQRYFTQTPGGSLETWPQINQGCRLGNHEPRSALCRAAALAANGWGDTSGIPLDEVAGFCNATYLENVLALCFITARRIGHPADYGAVNRPSVADPTGIPETDVVAALPGRHWPGVRGPDERTKTWGEITAHCARGVYAPQSPVCESAEIVKHRRRIEARVPYAKVASFCDVGAINRGSEVCRTAYRVEQSRSFLAR